MHASLTLHLTLTSYLLKYTFCIFLIEHYLLSFNWGFFCQKYVHRVAVTSLSGNRASCVTPAPAVTMEVNLSEKKVFKVSFIGSLSFQWMISKYINRCLLFISVAENYPYCKKFEDSLYIYTFLNVYTLVIKLYLSLIGLFFIHPSFRLTYTIYVELVENKFGTYTCTVYTIQFRISCVTINVELFSFFAPSFYKHGRTTKINVDIYHIDPYQNCRTRISKSDNNHGF